ncbi:MAG: Holliday junction resolvase RuvX [Candidatus Eisenbacteria bacterium]|nr:Holliday junction resolvase RuvX [Candidatus Eisenbacteria bacterium]
MSSRPRAPLLGVDYGRRRTGFATSDPDGILASPSGFVMTRGLEDLAARVHEKAAAAGAAAIVLGDPRHASGRPGDLSPEIEDLAERLRRLSLIHI